MRDHRARFNSVKRALQGSFSKEGIEARFGLLGRRHENNTHVARRWRARVYKHAAGRSEDLERRQCLSDAASAFRRCENSTGTANSYLHIRGFSSRGAVAASVRARASVRTLATPGISLISKWNDVTRAIPTTKIRFSFFFSPPFYIFPFFFCFAFAPRIPFLLSLWQFLRYRAYPTFRPVQYGITGYR